MTPDTITLRLKCGDAVVAVSDIECLKERDKGLRWVARKDWKLLYKNDTTQHQLISGEFVVPTAIAELCGVETIPVPNVQQFLLAPQSDLTVTFTTGRLVFQLT